MPRQEQGAAVEDRQAIQELDDKEIKANLGLDVRALALLWDTDIVSMPPDHSAISGLEANQAFLEKEAQALADFQILGYEQNWQEVRVLGDYAYEYGTVQTRVSPMNPGPEVDRMYNIMRILKKQPDGTWKIYRAIWNSALPLKAQEPEPNKTSPSK
ncbi:MAG TPA: DUF4440 domain-containing protein [Terriglobales bacterium]|nr:DUF4440 domain-containing protein [Terriglobales bacterium]